MVINFLLKFAQVMDEGFVKKGFGCGYVSYGSKFGSFIVIRYHLGCEGERQNGKTTYDT
jgi:hypothetical protein